MLKKKKIDVLLCLCIVNVAQSLVVASSGTHQWTVTVQIC